MSWFETWVSSFAVRAKIEHVKQKLNMKLKSKVYKHIPNFRSTGVEIEFRISN